MTPPSGVGSTSSRSGIPPQKADDTLKTKLREEASGILSWLIVGSLEWQTQKLRWPKVVTDYTHEYLAEQDIFQRWLDDRCDVHASYAGTSENLWESWSQYAWAAGVDPGSKTQTFPDMLREHGFEPARKIGPKRARGWKGLRPKSDEEHKGLI